MSEDIIFKGCKTGIDFENMTVDFLKKAWLDAHKTGKNDGGIDIVATTSINGTERKYYIQCKYYNKTVGKHPVQEVYAGSKY